MTKSYEDFENYKLCPYCNKYEHKSNYTNYHGENCIEHPINKEKNKNARRS